MSGLVCMVLTYPLTIAVGTGFFWGFGGWLVIGLPFGSATLLAAISSVTAFFLTMWGYCKVCTGDGTIYCMVASFARETFDLAKAFWGKFFAVIGQGIGNIFTHDVPDWFNDAVNPIKDQFDDIGDDIKHFF